MVKKRNNAWIVYGALMVIVGLWYIYYELKLPAEAPCKECEEQATQEEEEQDNV